MGLSVTFVSGPRRSGKSTIIETLLLGLYKRPPHYLRLASLAGDKRPPPADFKPDVRCAVRSARWLNYDENVIYEVLPEALHRIHRCDRYGAVVIEADADPHLRHVYPYDHRVFILPAPTSPAEVFRTPDEAADALRHVLDDTATFAREIYGMLDGDPSSIGGFPASSDGDPSSRSREPRPPWTLHQMYGFLNSPLGEELATRIQFKPDYHGLVESDLVLVNMGVGGISPGVDECARRIELVLARLRGPAARKNLLFCCDPLDPKDPLRRKLAKTLKELIHNPER